MLYYLRRTTLERESLGALPEGVDTTLLDPILGQTFDNDVAFKKAIAESLGEESAKQFESNLITAAISMNPKLILIGILGFVACFACSLGPVMWVLFSELFPTQVRGLAISLVGFINSAVSFLVQLVFPWELARFGSSMTFLIYGLFAAAGFLFVLMVVRETKGKSLEELEKILVKWSQNTPSTC